MHIMPIFLTVLGAILVVKVSLAKSFFAKLQHALIPGNDYWTWTTRDGSVYEDVNVTALENDKVTFCHKHGKTTLPLRLLSQAIRMNLLRSFPQTENVTGADRGCFNSFNSHEFATYLGESAARSAR